MSNVPGLTSSEYKQMVVDVNDMTWSNVLKIKGLDKSDYPDTKDNRRLVLFGMSLHIITDTFAHRINVKISNGDRWNGWVYIESGSITGKKADADDINHVPSRYKAAGQVVKNMFNLALNTNNIKLSKPIKSKYIMYNNKYFDGSFAVSNLMFMAEANKQNDETYKDWYKKMAIYTYTKDVERQKILDDIGF